MDFSIDEGAFRDDPGAFWVDKGALAGLCSFGDGSSETLYSRCLVFSGAGEPSSALRSGES